MNLRPFAAWSWVLLAVLPARGGISETPPIDAPLGAPAPPSASVGSLPFLPPALSAPAAPPAAASDGARYEPGAPPETERRELPTDRPDGLAPLRGALAARGETLALDMADRLYYTDPLTGLPNRAYYLERGEKAMRGVEDAAVALLDMDNFGAVNAGLADVHGVVKGRERADQVLALAGAALADLAGKKGVVVARLGGEEFVVLGARGKVLEFSAEARRMMPPGKLLSAAGIEEGGDERRAISAAQERLGRGGQPVADFTYGVSSALGLAPAAALARADAALNAAKEGGRRGVVSVAGEDGTPSDWTPPTAEGPAPELPSARAAPTSAEAVAELEARLTPREKAIFREAVFRDPLTLTRTYDYVGMRAAEWDRLYARGGTVSLVSARNLKQINDLLGHEAGDRYLRRLGEILRREIARARKKSHLDVREPVRVASKEFLLVGRDADAVARLAAKAAAESFDAGRMLSADEVKRLRAEVSARKLAPPDRIALIGGLRVVSEPIDADGRADSKAALERAFVRLETVKRGESGAESPPSAD